MKFYISYERNEIPQGIIVEAASENVAVRYFRHKKPDVRVYGIKEATFECDKPSMPVLTATVFEVWKDTELGDTYKDKEFFSWWEADEYIEKIEKHYPGWHFRIVEVKV